MTNEQIEELQKVAEAATWQDGMDRGAYWAQFSAFQNAANPAAIKELLSELKRTEFERAAAREAMQSMSAELTTLRAAASAPKAKLIDEQIDAIIEEHSTGDWLNGAAMREFARAVLAQAAPVAVPEGWKLVPVKLTEEMKDAPEVSIGGCYSCSAQAPTWGELEKIYDAMLAAAPAAPVAAAVPAGWVKNEGWEPQIEVEFRNGTRHTGEIGSFEWEIDGEHEQADVVLCRVTFGELPTAPAQDKGGAA